MTWQRRHHLPTQPTPDLIIIVSVTFFLFLHVYIIIVTITTTTTTTTTTIIIIIIIIIFIYLRYRLSFIEGVRAKPSRLNMSASVSCRTGRGDVIPP